MVEEKKKSDSEFLSYNLMLHSGKKFALCATKTNILTLVLSEKKFLNEAKNHNPPFKLNGRSLNPTLFKIFINDLPDYLLHSFDPVYINNNRIDCLFICR